MRVRERERRGEGGPQGGLSATAALEQASAQVAKEKHQTDARSNVPADVSTSSLLWGALSNFVVDGFQCRKDQANSLQEPAAPESEDIVDASLRNQPDNSGAWAVIAQKDCSLSLKALSHHGADSCRWSVVTQCLNI